jgi:hypothetical protein
MSGADVPLPEPVWVGSASVVLPVLRAAASAAICRDATSDFTSIPVLLFPGHETQPVPNCVEQGLRFY